MGRERRRVNQVIAIHPPATRPQFCPVPPKCPPALSLSVSSIFPTEHPAVRPKYHRCPPSPHRLHLVRPPCDHFHQEGLFPFPWPYKHPHPMRLHSSLQPSTDLASFQPPENSPSSESQLGYARDYSRSIRIGVELYISTRAYVISQPNWKPPGSPCAEHMANGR